MRTFKGKGPLIQETGEQEAPTSDQVKINQQIRQKTGEPLLQCGDATKMVRGVGAGLLPPFEYRLAYFRSVGQGPSAFRQGDP